MAETRVEDDLSSNNCESKYLLRRDPVISYSLAMDKNPKGWFDRTKARFNHQQAARLATINAPSFLSVLRM